MHNINVLNLWGRLSEIIYGRPYGKDWIVIGLKADESEEINDFQAKLRFPG